MDSLRAGAVFISERALETPSIRERAHRVASAISASRKEVLSAAEFERCIHTTPWEKLPRRGREQFGFDDRVVFLDAGSFEDGSRFAGRYTWTQMRSAHHEWATYGVVCQSAVEIQTVVGCGFDCSYCPYTRGMIIGCDIERFVERLDELFDQRPHQALYKLNNRSDSLIFEPEYGLTELLVNKFAQTDRQTLMLYSKSANVDHLLGLRHRGRTITCFTLSSPRTASLLEPSAPSFEARLAAAEKCGRAGYPVRFRFSPIVPFRNWKSEIVDMVKAMATRTKPELITLWTLSMIGLDDLSRIVDLDALDPVALQQAEIARGAPLQKGAPFPEIYRSEVYSFVTDVIASHLPEARVSVCLETPAVLDTLQGRLAIVGHQQVCNCGPACTSERLEKALAASDRAPRPQLHAPDGTRIGSC